jgi:hypothetical protein
MQRIGAFQTKSRVDKDVLPKVGELSPILLNRALARRSPLQFEFIGKN